MPLSGPSRRRLAALHSFAFTQRRRASALSSRPVVLVCLSLFSPFPGQTQYFCVLFTGSFPKDEGLYCALQKKGLSRGRGVSYPPSALI